jgi:large subunit ribosomal protein L9
VKVILKETIPTLGELGTVVEVSRGYARNYLIPQGKALEATPGNLALFEQQRAKLLRRQEKEKRAAEELAQRLSGTVVTLAQRVGEQERLYGSVTAAMVAEALAAQGFEVDKKQVELAEPIKQLGSYEVMVRLSAGVKAPIRVDVVPEQ